MGVDLQLVIDVDNDGSVVVDSRHCIDVDRDSDLWNPIVEKTKAWSHGVEFQNERRTHSIYGHPLRFITAEDLALVMALKPLSQWNKAVSAFVSALPPRMKIVLWWY